MLENQNYLLEINDKSCKVNLTKILTYSASGMPNDYLFTPLEGEEPLMSLNAEGYFPIPEFMISMLKITPLDEALNVASDVASDTPSEATGASSEPLNINEPLDSIESCLVVLEGTMGTKDDVLKALEASKKFNNTEDILGRIVKGLEAHLLRLKD